MATIHFALIGCGRIAGHHVRSLQATPGATLVALCDLELATAEQWLKQCLPSEPRPVCYTNYHEMFAAHPEIDVVCIATPSGMHFEHAMECLQRYEKHVCIEKPMVMTIEQGETLTWLDGYIEKLKQENELSGSMLIARGSQVLIEKYWGVADMENDQIGRAHV